ncbi:hypothetical protein BD408DRAFT_463411 [Parasitella parasitica]|nr:hypothetical protein BD408DRAFT_463411 [Parasitella parasitica]
MIDYLRSYYITYFDNVFTFDKRSSLEDFFLLVSNLDKLRGRQVVILATDLLSTGVTLPIDSVIDSGVTSEFTYGDNLVTRVERHCNSSESTQRLGRVGRITMAKFWDKF